MGCGDRSQIPRRMWVLVLWSSHRADLIYEALKSQESKGLGGGLKGYHAEWNLGWLPPLSSTCHRPVCLYALPHCSSTVVPGLYRAAIQTDKLRKPKGWVGADGNVNGVCRVQTKCQAGTWLPLAVSFNPYSTL